MAVSPYLLFIRKNSQSAALKKLPFIARGKALGKMYKALPAAEKAALVKAAKATPAPKHTKIRASVRKQARDSKVSVGLVKKLWKKTEGSSTAVRLARIAKTVAPRKVAAKKTPAAIKKALAVKKPVAAKKVVAKAAAPKKIVAKVAAKKTVVAKKAKVVAKKTAKK